MNNKGEMAKVGLLLVTAITIIIGLILLSEGIAPNANQSTTLWSVRNDSIAAPVAGVPVELRGQAVSGTMFMQNGTGGETINAANYTITNYNVVGGDLVPLMNMTAGSKYKGAGTTLNLTYSYEPYGYVRDSGSRAVVGLIVLFSALALLIAILPSVQDSIKDFMD